MTASCKPEGMSEVFQRVDDDGDVLVRHRRGTGGLRHRNGIRRGSYGLEAAFLAAASAAVEGEARVFVGFYLLDDGDVVVVFYPRVQRGASLYLSSNVDVARVAEVYVAAVFGARHLDERVHFADGVAPALAVGGQRLFLLTVLRFFSGRFFRRFCVHCEERVSLFY